MRLQVTAPESSREDVLAALRATEQCITESSDLLPNGSVVVTCQVDPGMFRSLNTMVQASGGAGAKVEVVSLAVVEVGEEVSGFCCSPLLYLFMCPSTYVPVHAGFCVVACWHGWWQHHCG